MQRSTLRAAALALALAVLPTAAPAQSATQAPGLSAKDVFELELTADPQISPDGHEVVYVRRWNDIMTDQGYSNLWLVSTDGSGERPLTSGKFHESSPRFSPDGRRILFVSDRDGSPQIYTLWLATGVIAPVTHVETAPSGIAWSPDGKQVSFTALVKEEGCRIADLPQPPEGAKWADPPRVVDRLTYRFNGQGYLPHGYTQLFVVPAEGGTPRQISSGPYQHGDFAFASSDPVWTPDGKFILLSANRHDGWQYEPLDSEVYEFRVADGSVRALTDRRGPDASPAISPDGRWIAYTGFDDRYQGYQVRHLYLMDRDGGHRRVLTAKLDRSVGQPHWATDGSGVYFVYDDRGDTKVGFVSLDGHLRTVAEHLGTNATSYSSGGTFSVASDGTLAFPITRPDLPSDVAVLSPGQPPDAARTLTAVNDDLLAQRRLGTVEEITYKSSVDGRPIEGWIVEPPGFDETKIYPFILEIHGGPFANYGDRFDLEKQVMAARGYIVLYVNPRGSTSYGEEFGNLIHHAYPGDDFFDLDSGVDAVVARGHVDPKELYVTGGSGGGVLTCWVIGRTHRFRAAAADYPVIDWTSFVLTADGPAFFTRYWFPGPPWEHPEEYWKRSVLSRVGEVDTPTMLMTGEEDYRTPISEAEQYYTALKLRKVDAVLVRVPGEPHGLRRRPSHHMTKMLEILAWFGQHRATEEAKP